MCQLTCVQNGFVSISKQDEGTSSATLGKRLSLLASDSRPEKKMKIVLGSEEEEEEEDNKTSLSDDVNEDEVVYVSENRPDVSAEEKIMLFVQAARSGDLDTIKSMVEEGCYLDCVHLGYTPLHCAAFYNHKEIVEYLIEQGATIDVRSQSGITPLAWAVDRGHKELVASLLEMEARPDIANNNNVTPLHSAVKAKNYAMVEILLSINTETEEWTPVNAKTKAGQTPAYFAAFDGSLDILTLLYEYNADMNIASPNNVVPLHRAASQGHAEIVRFLLETAGGKVNAQDSNGRTALHLATIYKHIGVIHILLEHGADQDLQDKSGESAPIVAKKRKFTEAEKLFSSFVSVVLACDV